MRDLRHSQARPPELQEISGREAMHQWLLSNFVPFPDYQEELEWLVGEGDFVAWRSRGTGLTFSIDAGGATVRDRGEGSQRAPGDGACRPDPKRQVKSSSLSPSVASALRCRDAHFRFCSCDREHPAHWAITNE